MAQYTVELRELIENGVDIFSFNYPIYDENHREELEKKIINHYYFREIGFETVGRFKHYLSMTMNEIMPKYNRIYKAYAEKEIEIFANMKTDANEEISTTKTNQGTNNLNSTLISDVERDKSETHGKTGTRDNTNVVDRDMTNSNTNVVDSEGTNTVSQSNSNKRVYSDTPQGRTDLEDTEFATEVSNEDQNADTTDTSKVDTTTTDSQTLDEDITTTDAETTSENLTVTAEDTEKVVTDKNDTQTTSNDEQGSNIRTGGETGYFRITESELLQIYLKTQIEVDVMIIAELNNLFLGVY